MDVRLLRRGCTCVFVSLAIFLHCTFAISEYSILKNYFTYNHIYTVTFINVGIIA